jgi:hypothetical protein
MATIIGVFDNDADLERALNQLNQAGFEDDLRVIDPARPTRPNVSDEAMLGGIGAANTPAGSGSGNALPYVVPPFITTDEANRGEDILGVLGEYDLEQDEADYYVQRIQKGGKLVIVKTEDEQRDFVQDVMRRSQAQQWTGKDTR